MASRGRASCFQGLRSEPLCAEDGAEVKRSERIEAEQRLPELEVQLRQQLIKEGVDPDIAAQVGNRPPVMHVFFGQLPNRIGLVPHPQKNDQLCNQASSTHSKVDYFHNCASTTISPSMPLKSTMGISLKHAPTTSFPSVTPAGLHVLSPVVAAEGQCCREAAARGGLLLRGRPGEVEWVVLAHSSLEPSQNVNFHYQAR
eukprot:1161781-Pelagomonas_calceolata.AAC.13